MDTETKDLEYYKNKCKELEETMQRNEKKKPKRTPKVRATKYDKKGHHSLDLILNGIDVKKTKLYEMKRLLKKYDTEYNDKHSIDSESKPTNSLHIMFLECKKWYFESKALEDKYDMLSLRYGELHDKYEFEKERWEKENHRLKKELTEFKKQQPSKSALDMLDYAYD